MAPTFLHASLRRRNRLAAAAALLLAVAAPPALVAAAFVAAVLPLAALAPLSLLAGIVLWTANPAPRERLGCVAAGELGLFFDGRRLASRASIREARMLPGRDDAPVVRLVAGVGAIELRVADARAGDALVRALGLGVDAHPRSVRLASRVLTDPAALAQVALVAAALPLLFGAVGFVSRAHPILCAALGAAAAALVLFVLLALTAPTALVLEEGGITVGWLGRRRFLRYDELEVVRTWEDAPQALGGGRRRGLSLFLCNGEALTFALDEAAADVAAVVEELRAAMDARPSALGYRRGTSELAP